MRLRDRERQRQERRRSQDRQRGRSRSRENNKLKFTQAEFNLQREELEKAFKIRQTEKRGRFDAAMALERARLTHDRITEVTALRAEIAALEAKLAAQAPVQAQVPVQYAYVAPVTVHTATVPTTPAVAIVSAPQALTMALTNTHPLVGQYLVPGIGNAGWKPVDRSIGNDAIWVHASCPEIDWLPGKHWQHRPYYMVADPSIRVYSVMFENIRPNTIGMVSVDELQKEAANRINNLELAKAKRAKQGNTQGKGGGKGGGKGKGNGAGGKGRGGIPARGRGRAQFPTNRYDPISTADAPLDDADPYGTADSNTDAAPDAGPVV